MLIGTITEFSFERGLGSVTTDHGQSYMFHAIEIVDGSRNVDVGIRVRFQPFPKFGSIEAGKIQKV